MRFQVHIPRQFDVNHIKEVGFGLQPADRPPKISTEKSSKEKVGAAKMAAGGHPTYPENPLMPSLRESIA